MGKKKRRRVEKEIWCYYCNKTYHDEGTLLAHQKSKHFRCDICRRPLQSMQGLRIHYRTVHKTRCQIVPEAVRGRDDPEANVIGMDGIPESVLAERGHSTGALSNSANEGATAAGSAAPAATQYRPQYPTMMQGHATQPLYQQPQYMPFYPGMGTQPGIPPRPPQISQVSQLAAGNQWAQSFSMQQQQPMGIFPGQLVQPSASAEFSTAASGMPAIPGLPPSLPPPPPQLSTISTTTATTATASVDGNLSSVAVDGGAASAGTGVASLPGVLAAPSTDVASSKTSPTAAHGKNSVPPAEIVAPKAPVQRKTCMVFEGKEELSMEELRAQARKARGGGAHSESRP